MEQTTRIKYQLKWLTIVYMAGIAVSGITAFPLLTELSLLDGWFLKHNTDTMVANWVHKVYNSVSVTNQNFPFIFYGTDWLAFAHIVIALLFIGVLRDPVKNIWVMEWSMIASLGVFPLAFIAGSIREIPFFHQLIDCSFGVAGFTLGFIIRKKILLLQNEYPKKNKTSFQL